MRAPFNSHNKNVQGTEAYNDRLNYRNGIKTNHVVTISGSVNSCLGGKCPPCTLNASGYESKMLNRDKFVNLNTTVSFRCHWCNRDSGKVDVLKLARTPRPPTHTHPGSRHLPVTQSETARRQSASATVQSTVLMRASWGFCIPPQQYPLCICSYLQGTKTYIF